MDGHKGPGAGTGRPVSDDYQNKSSVKNSPFGRPGQAELTAAEGLWSQRFIASNWRRMQSHSLQGFFDLLLQSGITLHDCTLHELNGKRWIGLLARPQVTKDGRILLSPKNNRPVYSACVTINDRDRREVFQKDALAAIDELQGREGAL